ncbi:MAG: hypothetical protein AABY26_00150, partial [Nanoarchaeota archaeon]
KAGAGVKGPTGMGARGSTWISREEIEERRNEARIIDPWRFEDTLRDRPYDIWNRYASRRVLCYLIDHPKWVNSALLRPLVNDSSVLAANALTIFPISRYDEAGLKKYRPEFSVEDTFKTELFNNHEIRMGVRTHVSGLERCLHRIARSLIGEYAPEYEVYAGIRRVRELENDAFPMVFRYAPPQENSGKYKYIFSTEEYTRGVSSLLGLAREDFDYIKNGPVYFSNHTSYCRDFTDIGLLRLTNEIIIDEFRDFTTHLYVLKREDEVKVVQNGGK